MSFADTRLPRGEHEGYIEGGDSLDEADLSWLDMAGADGATGAASEVVTDDVQSETAYAQSRTAPAILSEAAVAEARNSELAVAVVSEEADEGLMTDEVVPTGQGAPMVVDGSVNQVPAVVEALALSDGVAEAAVVTAGIGLAVGRERSGAADTTDLSATDTFAAGRTPRDAGSETARISDDQPDASSSQPGGAEVADAADGAAPERPDGGEVPPPGYGRELGYSGGDGELPPRERRDVLAMSEEQKVKLGEVDRSLVSREQDGSVHRLTLSDGNTAEFTVEDEDGSSVVRDWHITVDPDLQDAGIGRRLADASVDDFVYNGVQRVEVGLTSEASLRTAVDVFGSAIRYEELSPDQTPVASDSVLTPADALQIVQRTETPAGDDLEAVAEPQARIRAVVDMDVLVARRPDLALTEHERVIDRCDFSTPTIVGPTRRHMGYMPDPETGEPMEAEVFDPGFRHGDAIGFVRRCNTGEGNPDERDNARIVASEHLANYGSHVAPQEPGVPYRVRRSTIYDPVTGTTKIRISSYFYGIAKPATVRVVRAELAQDNPLDPQRALVGRTRDEQQRTAEEEDRVKQEGAASLADRTEATHGEVAADLTTEESHAIQQTGRGFAVIRAATSVGVWLPLQPQGGMFVYDILPHNPAPAPDPRSTEEVLAAEPELEGEDLDAAIEAALGKLNVEDEDLE